MSAAFDVFWVFLRLGCTSFGGPIAHLAYFRDALVVRRKWLDEAAYADLVALCQVLPGPSSSQVGFAIGIQRAGALGGLAAWLGFTAPSAALMLAAGLGAFGSPSADVIHGLKLVALAIVAHAVFGMSRTLLLTRFHWALALLTLAALLVFSQMVAPILILIAGAIGALRAPKPAMGVASHDETPTHTSALTFVLALGALMIAILAAAQINHPLAQQSAAMAQTGALVFGGGHAVLPLMEAEAVGQGWMREDMFLAGYGFAQALPGPLFSFAAFVGAASGHGVGGALLMMAALFLPGLLLTAAALPLWRRLKRFPRALGFAVGASAAVVGALAAALYDPIFTSSVRSVIDLALAASGFAALQWLRAPSWAVVLLLGVAGALYVGLWS